ncbi:MAG: hypothetical protein Q8Q15_03430 [bacterium]|nr:hypothetical protein [bacterium]
MPMAFEAFLLDQLKKLTSPKRLEYNAPNMEPNPEKKKSPLKVVHLDEKFPLYNQHTGKFETPDETRYNMDFILRIDRLLPEVPTLRMSVLASDQYLPGSVCFFPYSPELGLRKVPESLSLKTFIEGYAESIGPDNLNNLSPNTGFNLWLHSNRRGGKGSGFLQLTVESSTNLFPREMIYHYTDKPRVGFKLEIREKIRKLRLQLLLPNGIYETIPEEEIFDLCVVSYSRFSTPSIQRILSTNPSPEAKNGVHLIIPLEKLKETKGKFSLSTE